MLDSISSPALDKSQYWNSYYSSHKSSRLTAPSQFAAFVAQEAPDAEAIIEIGCGNGRDSLFFARHGFTVVAFDGSSEAIDSCCNLAEQHDIRNVSFRCADVGKVFFDEALSNGRAEFKGIVVVYARFFLHAITESEERSLLEALSKSLHTGDKLAFEYRTMRDASGTKVTPDHYRRFVDPAKVVSNAAKLGFTVEYAVEGFGFAKYKDDDAYVARCIMAKD